MSDRVKYSILRGFRDVLPDESEYWHRVRREIDEIALIYGFNQIKTPTLEESELFYKSSGEFTDVVSKEMYTFSDQSGKSVALRPEGTPGCIRAVIENNLINKYPLPLKLYYIEEMFRHERPQSGRFREHTQIGFEIIGDKGPCGEAELISLLFDFYGAIGLSDLSCVINSIGCRECREPYFNSIRDFLKSHEASLCENCKIRAVKNPLRALDCKETGCREIFKDAPIIKYFLCTSCTVHFAAFKDVLDESGYRYTENPSLVRGLDYYSKTAFEIVHNKLGAQNTIAGGGRYDYLVSGMGGEDISCVGFGAGVERIILSMQNEGINLERSKPEYAILVMGDAYLKFGRSILSMARKSKKSCVINYEAKPVKKLIHWADKIGAKFAIFIGEREFKESILTVKNLRDGTQKEIKTEEFEKMLD